jgi:hypothetical protein
MAYFLSWPCKKFWQFTIIKYGKHLYFEVLSNTVYSNQTRMRGGGGGCASPLEMCAQCLCFVELVIIIAYEHLFTNKVQTLKCTCKLFLWRKLAPNFQNLKRNWQVRNELGNRLLKSDLKSAINIFLGLSGRCHHARPILRHVYTPPDLKR